MWCGSLDLLNRNLLSWHIITYNRIELQYISTDSVLA